VTATVSFGPLAAFGFAPRFELVAGRFAAAFGLAAALGLAATLRFAGPRPSPDALGLIRAPSPVRPGAVKQCTGRVAPSCRIPVQRLHPAVRGG
jgi:hypothetical protein